MRRPQWEAIDMPNEDYIVRIKDINLRYGTHHAVKDVSLDVRRSEVLTIVGPSGAGKSTLLKAINMLEQPCSGTTQVGAFSFSVDRRLTSGNLLKLRRSTGMVFQSFNLFPHVKVERNISLLQMRVLGITRAQADARTRQLLERVHVAGEDAVPAAKPLSPVSCPTVSAASAPQQKSRKSVNRLRNDQTPETTPACAAATPPSCPPS